VIASDLASKSQVVGEIDHTLFGGGSEHGRGSAPKAKLRSKSLPLRRRTL
jgi:hypothetical protein